ncbi:hypothetical protein [Williamsia muralis]|uniref:Uncharacterized protein n=1 Tax=Williamsia marianensis TaxID=85044 RepID=A0ABU4EX56_WILMA|nr:hypothetical protein [Williamsia muralis]MDV7135224.1 hypothetical protein [Williamsia muralis]
MTQHRALTVADNPLALIMLAELPEEMSAAAFGGQTGSVTPEMLTEYMALIDRHCPASATVSSATLHAAVNAQLAVYAPTMPELCASYLDSHGGFGANIWVKAAVLQLRDALVDGYTS